MRGLAAALLLLPGAAFACALPPSVVMTLPTGFYMTGAALTVALTAALGALSHRLPVMQPRLLLDRRVWLPVNLTSYAAFLCFFGLVLVGHLGSRDPMHNLMTLVIWTVVWVALPLGSMLFGNLWRAVNPWTAPVRLVRALLGRRGGVGLARLGHGPAVAGLLAFAWFLIVSLSPDDPLVLAQVALAYWLGIFVLAVLEGEDWLEQGEFLTVYMGFIARIAPLWLEIDGRRARLYAGWPGTQVLAMPPLTPSAVAFVMLALAALTFDGLRETFWWLGLVGENPLEFSGRSAVMGVNTAGLLAAWALTAAAILGALRLGRLAGAALPTGPVSLSFLAIAAGYHGAHYLVTLLTSGQYTLAALNDPLFRGDAWLGLAPFYVSFGFLSNARMMTLVWNLQFAAILGAHVLAVLLALRLGGRVRAVAHLPMTALMIGYTVLGLWLLSSPLGA
ncbi:hypothetical protein RNZ50_21595 [Paracoccaceae bacterium Fryx2]|nr:hypothetical protein [Paracoccaceae bacterium Fryx2]